MSSGLLSKTNAQTPASSGTVSGAASTFQKLERVKAGLAALRSGCDYHGVSLNQALLSSIKLYVSDQFSIKEIIGFTLYVPEIRRQLPILISKQRSLAKLAATNPASLQDQTENKSVFYELCRAANLPIPECYGVFKDGGGVDIDGGALEGKADWVAYFKRRLPSHFVIKELGGAYGSGFAAFERRGDEFILPDGHTTDAAGFYDELCRKPDDERILQQRLFDHPDLEALSGRPGLQTIRINTTMNDDGSVSLLFYWLKVCVGDNVVDNFSMGSTGNLAGFGYLDKGVLKGARGRHPSGVGLTTVHTHPKTGMAFDGFRIPLWDEAVKLAKKAHREAFSSFGSLGWDIAVTPEGPKLIETNVWWDPPMFATMVMTDDDWRRVFG